MIGVVLMLESPYQPSSDYGPASVVSYKGFSPGHRSDAALVFAEGMLAKCFGPEAVAVAVSHLPGLESFSVLTMYNSQRRGAFGQQEREKVKKW